MKTAFIFPGQGAQVVGMGKDIAEAFPAAAEIFKKSNDIVGYDLQTICFDGPSEKLNATTVSQPAIFATSAAILEVLKVNAKTASIKPDVTAGLSMGEYTALYAAGVINFADALTIVQKRGQAMQASADSTDGAMVSIIGLDEQKTNQLCAEARQNDILEAVNFNCPGQIVISGSNTACQRAESLAEKYGAMKAIRLSVSGGFHTSLMSGAAESLANALAASGISEPNEIKIIANINADYYKSEENIKEGLTKQLTSPILWQKCMEKLLAQGVENFYEIGPGTVLTGLMRRINRKTRVINVSNLQTLKNLLES